MNDFVPFSRRNGDWVYRNHEDGSDDYDRVGELDVDSPGTGKTFIQMDDCVILFPDELRQLADFIEMENLANDRA